MLPVPFNFFSKQSTARGVADVQSMLCLINEAPMLTIRLPQSIEKRLDKIARRTGRNKTFYAREAILNHLEDLEDVYIAERRSEQIRSGKMRTIPLGKLMKRYGPK
jgi:RHH-type transcriptional regulator, rel operon repressor / antitoxin RelB